MTWKIPPIGPPRPFCFGTDIWPGLAKLAEECDELTQIAAKIIAYPDFDIHPDGGNLKERLTEELADVAAISLFVIEHARLNLKGDR